MTDTTETTIIHPDGISFEDVSKTQPILTFINGEQVGRIVYLAEDRVTFGRSTACTIQVHDQRVSRQHMEVTFDRGWKHYRVADIGSSNGVYVNNEKITTHVLDQGDKIVIGGTILNYALVDSLDIQFHGELDRLINQDELTGLLVPRRFNEELSRIIAVSHTNGTSLGMLVMDMDGLKAINDTYGHHFGGYAIVQTGTIIKKIVSGKGLASRFAGDEFMAFFLDAGLKEALQFGEQIRAAVEGYGYCKNGIEIFPTISIGAADLASGDTVDTLFERADKALYRAKTAGRNRVCA